MRITVYDVLSYLASGMTEQAILRDFPYLTHQEQRAARRRAAGPARCPPLAKQLLANMLPKAIAFLRSGERVIEITEPL